jgi:putative endonuclease
LIHRGYKILARNYKTSLGEIDIVARDKDSLVFIEVKARRSDRFGMPCEAVSKFKQRQISKAALLYLKEKNLLNQNARFDIVSILYSRDEPKLDLIKDAFELDKSFPY